MPARAKILRALDGKPPMSIPALRAAVDDESRGDFGAALADLVELREVEVDMAGESVKVRRPAE